MLCMPYQIPLFVCKITLLSSATHLHTHEATGSSPVVSTNAVGKFRQEICRLPSVSASLYVVLQGHICRGMSCRRLRQLNIFRLFVNVSQYRCPKAHGGKACSAKYVRSNGRFKPIPGIFVKRVLAYLWRLVGYQLQQHSYVPSARGHSLGTLNAEKSTGNLPPQMPESGLLNSTLL